MPTKKATAKAKPGRKKKAAPVDPSIEEALEIDRRVALRLAQVSKNMLHYVRANPSKGEFIPSGWDENQEAYWLDQIDIYMEKAGV